MQAYASAAGGEAFDRSRTLMDATIGWLAEAVTAELSHGDLEECLQVRVREVFRQLLQDHLDLRAVRETPVAQALGSDGVARRHVEPDHDRGLVTVFGKVTVTRLAYRPRARRTFTRPMWC